ncbi:MAG: DNA-3-methyladenine glycosylase [Limisphaerales bacterium]
MMAPSASRVVRYRVEFGVRDYDLATTLDSGQAFRWTRHGEVWAGVVRGRWLALRQAAEPDRIVAETVEDPGDWHWLRDYLRVDEDLATVLATFPDDRPMTAAVAACRGLRLLRQEPWECLASFLLSSTKQIPQIQAGVRNLSERFGERVQAPAGGAAVFAFPEARVLAGVSESELRECRIGFRARYLRETAEAVAGGAFPIGDIGRLPLDEARERLVTLPGVGPKIADCVLLFAYGFARAFPVDVWVMRALRELYFTGRRPTAARLKAFSETHFGPNAGYAQQYLFHHARMRAGRVANRRDEEGEKAHDN